MSYFMIRTIVKEVRWRYNVLVVLSLEPQSSKVRSGLSSNDLKRRRCYPTPLLNREVVVTQRFASTCCVDRL